MVSEDKRPRNRGDFHRRDNHHHREFHARLVDVTPHNFAQVSQYDEFVHAACRPGYSHDDVTDWIEFMLDRHIRRVLCLLSHAELAKYDNLLDAYGRRFTVVHVPIDDDFGIPTPDIAEQALAALTEAQRERERIVIHCAAGEDRTGLISTAWLLRRHKQDVNKAIAEVRESAKRAGAHRNPEGAHPEKGRALLGTLAISTTIARAPG